MSMSCSLDDFNVPRYFLGKYPPYVRKQRILIKNRTLIRLKLCNVYQSKVSI